MTSITVAASTAIALAVALAVVTPFGDTTTAFATATFDTGVPTVVDTSNGGHSTLLSYST